MWLLLWIYMAGNPPATHSLVIQAYNSLEECISYGQYLEKVADPSVTIICIKHGGDKEKREL